MIYNNFNILNEKNVYINYIKEEQFTKDKESRTTQISLCFAFKDIKEVFLKRKNILKKIFSTNENKLYIDNNETYYRATIENINFDLKNNVYYINIDFNCSNFKIKEEVYDAPNYIDPYTQHKYILAEMDVNSFNKLFDFELYIENKKYINSNIAKYNNGKYISDYFIMQRIDSKQRNDVIYLFDDFECFNVYINSRKQILEIAEIKENQIVDKKASVKQNSGLQYTIYKILKEMQLLKILVLDDFNYKVVIYKKIYN